MRMKALWCLLAGGVALAALPEGGDFHRADLAGERRGELRKVEK